jgi:hypothetical protein
VGWLRLPAAVHIHYAIRDALRVSDMRAVFEVEEKVYE